jgi:MoxR-like ATPase
MLVGRAGSGKNHTLEQVAEALDLDFYFSNAVTQEYTLKGFIDANGHFHETQFYKAFSQGGMFFLDEMDASIPEALIVLNSAIANGYFDFPIGRVRKHERFRVVSASNTWGTGANAVYIGRNQLDGATLDRFVQIEFDYDTELERGLTSDNDLYEFTIDLRKAIDKTQTRAIVSMRALLNADKLNGVLPVDEIIKSVYIKGMNKADLDIILAEMKTGDKNKYTAELKKIVKNMED